MQNEETYIEALKIVKEDLSNLDTKAVGYKWLRSILNEKDDYTLHRFLIGYNYNTDKILDILKEAAIWRIEYGTDAVCEDWANDLSKEAELVRRYWVESETGKALDGKPVIVLRLWRIDFAELLKRATIEKIMLSNIYKLESIIKSNPEGECHIIIDLGTSPEESETNPVSMWNMRSWASAVIKFTREVSKISDRFYPEIIKSAHFLRTPSYAPAIWKIVRLFMTKRTREKFTFHSGIPMDVLLKEMPIESIPKCFGGESPVELPHGGDIKKLEKLRESQASEKSKENIQKEELNIPKDEDKLKNIAKTDSQLNEDVQTKGKSKEDGVTDNK